MGDITIREQLGGIKGFLLDMDGTFYLGDRLLEGSLPFLERLRKTGRSALFVTNNSSRSVAMYRDKLQSMGVAEPFLQVLTSGQVAGRYALGQYPGKKAFLLGNQWLRQELEQMGLSFDGHNPDYVLVGYDTSLDYAKMSQLCDWVRAGLPYIATHPDLNCPTEQGFAPDIGAIIAFVEASTGRRPDVILGKPYEGIVRDALAQTGLRREELAMVGDRLYTDIATGNNFGMMSILVLTGETKAEDVPLSGIKPTLTVEGLGALVAYL